MSCPFVKPAAQVGAIDPSRGLATVRDSEMCARLRQPRTEHLARRGRSHPIRRRRLRPIPQATSAPILPYHRSGSDPPVAASNAYSDPSFDPI